MLGKGEQVQRPCSRDMLCVGEGQGQCGWPWGLRGERRRPQGLGCSRVRALAKSWMVLGLLREVSGEFAAAERQGWLQRIPLVSMEKGFLGTHKGMGHPGDCRRLRAVRGARTG